MKRETRKTQAMATMTPRVRKKGVNRGRFNTS
jgi:hypothetical protein